MVEVSLLKLFRLFILAFLVTVTLIVCYQGPFLEAMNQDTTFRQTYQQIENIPRLEWPDLTFCSSPFYKNKAKYANFWTKLRKMEFDENLIETVNETFFTQKNDVIAEVLMGTAYEEMLENPSGVKFVETKVIDYSRTGFCSVLSLQKMKLDLIEKGIIEKNVIDNDFIVAVLVKIPKGKDNEE